MRTGIPTQYKPRGVKDCSKKVIYWKKRLAIAAHKMKSNPEKYQVIFCNQCLSYHVEAQEEKK